jgi:uncharacterized protein (TIGR03083 family)
MPTHLSLDDHVAALLHSGGVLRDAADRAGLDAPVPTCPVWDVRKLVIHQGAVHRWAAANLRGEDDHRTDDSKAEAERATDLLAWFSAGLEALVDTIRTTTDDAQAMTFLDDAPPPRRFWARRQAHETTIHSADAVAAVLGYWPTTADLAVRPELAADGIDELLCGFITRGNGAVRVGEPLTMVVVTDDTGHAWTVRIAEGSLTTTAGAGDGADATLSGTASQLYLGLWNRTDEITVRGRDDVVELWRSQVRVRWGG